MSPHVDVVHAAHGPEARLLELHVQEQSLRQRSSALAAELAGLFEALPDDAVPRVRAALDGGLVFRKDGSAADLRGLVFECLSHADRLKVLRRIRTTCHEPLFQREGFVVLSDVDDTLLPGHDPLGISGCDRSWYLDGRLYPGVSQTHLELRAGLRDDYGEDYSVLLTARPPPLVGSLANKLSRIAGLKNPKMAILPGICRKRCMLKAAMRVMMGEYTQLGKTKVARMLEYAMLFPDYAGRFVFIGDDGQADVEAAHKMLSLTVPGHHGRQTSEHHEVPLFAFVAIHAVRRDDGYAVHPRKRQQMLEQVRLRNPAVPIECSRTPAPRHNSDAARHRFFYFVDYDDLAEQMASAGWIGEDRRDAIVDASMRDRRRTVSMQRMLTVTSRDKLYHDSTQESNEHEAMPIRLKARGQVNSTRPEVTSPRKWMSLGYRDVFRLSGLLEAKDGKTELVKHVGQHMAICWPAVAVGHLPY